VVARIVAVAAGIEVAVAAGTGVLVAVGTAVDVWLGMDVEVGPGVDVRVAVGIGGVVGLGATVAVLVLVAGGGAGMNGVVTSCWSGPLAASVVGTDGGRGVGVLLPGEAAVAAGVLVAVSVAADPMNLGVGVSSAVAVIEAISVPGVVNSMLKRSVCSNSPAGETVGPAGSCSSEADVAVGAGIVAWLRSSSSDLDGEPATVTAIQAMIAISVTAPIAAVTMGARVSSVRDSIVSDLHSIPIPSALAINRLVGGVPQLYAVAKTLMLSTWDRV